jgi:hypothetical protein
MVMGLFVDEDTSRQISAVLTGSLAKSLVAASALKLAYDVALLMQLAGIRNSPLKRSALLVIGPLQHISLCRLGAGAMGGIIIPFFVLLEQSQTQDWNVSFVGGACIVLVWVGCLVGELLERYLFFAAVSAPRMPGGVRP